MEADSVQYVFVCPHCCERFVVDTSIQEELLENGCVFCKALVSKDDFERETRPS